MEVKNSRKEVKKMTDIKKHPLIDDKVIEYFDKIGKCIFDEEGREIGDPRKLYIQTGLVPEESLNDRIEKLSLKAFVRMNKMAQETDLETFEDSIDFDIDEEEELTPFEKVMMPDTQMEEQEEVITDDRTSNGDSTATGDSPDITPAVEEAGDSTKE